MTDLQPRRDVNSLSAELARLTEEANQLADGSAQEPAGTGLVAHGSDVPAEVVKANAARKRAAFAHKSAELRKVREELRTALEAQMSAALSALGPMEAEMRKLEEAISTVNLYLGRDEDIVTLRDGEPAAVDTPLTVRQLVLAMDEECAVAAEAGGIDALDVDQFDRWLLEDPAHLDQVLPEPRGVVVLFPRRSPRDYGDPWKNAGMDAANRESHWLIRNGERLFRLTTGIDVGSRLVPTRDEFLPLFKDRRYNFETRDYDEVVLEPGSDAWVAATKVADGRRRHYMRIALVLQGLIDRTTVFAPLPPGTTFLDSSSYDSGRVRIVTDAERALTTGQETFKAWQQRLNGQLRPGMRLVAAFNSEGWRAASISKRWGVHTRLSPEGASHPASNVPHVIEERRSDGSLVFRYTRTDEVWDDDEYRFRPAKTRASCRIFPTDTFVLPFDLADVPTMQRFLQDRTSRGSYLEMFPLLKAAIRLKKDEAAQEEPFRLLLAGEVGKAHGTHLDPAGDELDSLVAWWKTTNRRHRPLVGDSTEDQARAISDIVAEYGRRQDAAKLAAAGAEVEASVVADLRSRFGDELLSVWRHANGTFVGYAVQDERDSAWVQRIRVSKTGRSVKVEPWQLPSSQNRSTWRELWSSERWAGWGQHVTAAETLSGPELETAAEEAFSLAAARGRSRGADTAPVAVTYYAKDRAFRVWTWERTRPEFARPDRPLTGGWVSQVSLGSVVYRWKRTTGGSVALQLGGMYGGRAWGSRGRGSELGPPPWEGELNERVLFVDESLAGEAHEAAEHALSLRAAQSELSGRSTAAMVSLEKAWVAAAEQEAYDRFLEDYVDETLWEGHRKTLKFRFPHDVHRSSFGGSSTLRNLVERLVECGVNLDGLTVADAVELFVGRFDDEDAPELSEDVTGLRFHVTD